MRPRRRVVVVTATAAATMGIAAWMAAGALGQGETAPGTAGSPVAAPLPAAALDPVAARTALLDAAAGWRDVLEAHRAPTRPRPGDTEHLILVLTEPAAASASAGARRQEALRAATEQQEQVLPVLADLGATVTGRTTLVGNTISVRVPAGKGEALARLAEVAQVVPVSFLAPAAVDEFAAPGDGGTDLPVTSPDSAPAPSAPASPGGRGPGLRVALIDAGVDVTHPALGGGIGPTFPIVGGVDFVDGDADPRVDATQVRTEAHGTQMAGLVLGSGAFEGLRAAERPRLVVYRVVGAEPVSGRLRPLARTDRVLAALEHAVDPNRDGDTDDRARVILVGLASGFAGDGADPLADAVEAAHDLGSTVVVPAGNDGPTLARPGSLGSLASAPSAITVGGLAPGGTERTARLDVRIGPAAAGLEELPLLGPAVEGGAMPAVILDDEAGTLLSGDLDDHYADERGTSRVRGALAVVARGGGSLEEKARLAAAAGARALAVWDETGPATFPVSAGDLGLPIPLVGLGRAQGEALRQLQGQQGGVELSLTQTAGRTTEAGIATFSSWGPTVDGRRKPELVAPAVAVPSALPGRGTDGRPREGTLTGTSAAAAEVAARAARLRVERPGLGTDGVRSLLVQGATELEGAPPSAQGAGVVGEAADAPVAVAPAIVQAVSGTHGRAMRIAFSLIDVSGRGGRYDLELHGDNGVRRGLGAAQVLRAGGRVRVEVTLTGEPVAGTILVRRPGGAVVATAPLAVLRPSRTEREALGTPTVRVGSGLAQVMVRVGSMERRRGQVRANVLHSLRIQLIPAAGGEPVNVFGAKQDGDWPAGTYRFIVADRSGDGLDIAPGAYRVRVIAAGAGGTTYRRESARFSLD